jgi:signal transduction histidine kinase
LVLFFKKEQERKHFFLKKEAKNFCDGASLTGRNTRPQDMADIFVDPPDALAEARARIAKLEAALRAREDFIASVGHEMRNPMVPIVLGVERLRDLSAAGDLERIRRNVEILGKATDAFMRRTTQLLDLARHSSGSFLLIQERVDFSKCIADTVDRHAEIARRAGCALRASVMPGITGLGDRGALEQALDNLLSNAFKYGSGRPVDVTFSVCGAEGLVQVRDHGAGIPAEEQGQIFGLFERARNLDRPGLGIGLWIAAQIAAAMGGGIGVASKPGEGATFTLTFPIASHEPPAGERDFPSTGIQC